VSELSAFDYAILRVVPLVEREEFINVGVLLLCRQRAFLGARTKLDATRLHALDPRTDAEAVRAHLAAMHSLVEGSPNAGPLGQMSPAERFHWLTHPRSTTIQVSPVHSGLCDDPQVALDDLFVRLVE
jgi:Protein of unknown function (DUF3037)